MNRPETIAQGVTLYPGDCMAVLPEFGEGCVDSCVTDPPYHLTSIVKRFGKTSQGDATDTSARARAGADGMARLSRGFMGKQWDGGEIAFEPETWAAVYRVLKPGGHLCAFGAPKNFGFMQYAISQAGFEIRDVLAWLFGSGFPKSHNLPGGFGTALKPAYEPIILARKPLVGTVAANVQEHGTGALNIDGCRVATDENLNGGAYCGDLRDRTEQNQLAGGNLRRGIGRQPMPGDEREGAALGMFQEGKTAGTAFKQPPGRWPANVIHDGSEEVVGAFPDVHGAGAARGGGLGNPERKSGLFGLTNHETNGSRFGDEGSAARFFYSAKADADDRLGSKHPTVKPLDLMQYLVRLVTPPKGLVLDLFAGTGTTGEAASREGMRAILIEREPEYQDDIRRRMKLAMAGPDERSRESIKAKLKDVPADHGPLFADLWREPFYKDAAE